MSSESGSAGGRIVAWLVATVMVAAGSGYFLYREFAPGESAQPAQPPAAVVSAAAAERQTWTERLSAIGTVEAIEGIDVTAEVSGTVVEIAFEAGERVEAGDLLVRLRTDTEEAARRALEAELAKARLDESRARELAETRAVPQARLDEAVSRRRALEARVAQQAALIDKKVIEAPFAGTLGIRRVSPGQLIEPGTTIVTLQSISPIFVNFTLPEQAWSGVQAGQSVDVEVGAWPDETFRGQIVAINPKISELSRSFIVQAKLSNDDGALQPGMFADVTVDLGETREVVAVPVTAVTYNAYGESVYLVEKAESDAGSKAVDESGTDGPPSGRDAASDARSAGGDAGPALIARRAFVRSGERRGHYIEIVEGLEPGDRVVSSGQVKLSDGYPIEIAGQDVLERVDPRPAEP